MSLLSMKKSAAIWVIIMIIFIGGLVIQNNLIQFQNANKPINQQIVILLWYDFAVGERRFPMEISSQELGCSSRANCLFTKDREMLNISTAIIFKGANG